MEMLITKVNGIEMSFGRRGAGRPLLLLHGYPLDHSIWEPIEPLLENDFELILPDLRGFGGSTLPGIRYQLSDMAEDAAMLLDQLGIRKAVVAGHSMGGYIALALARSHPEKVIALGLVSTQAAADRSERIAARYQQAQKVEANGVAEVADSMPALLSGDKILQAWLKDLILKQSPAGVAGALRAMAERSDSTLYLPGFDFPVSIIHGLADRLLPVERAREMQAGVKQGTLTLIELAGHMPMMESAEMTAGALRRLL